jgi:hypothetical protein
VGHVAEQDAAAASYREYGVRPLGVLGYQAGAVTPHASALALPSISAAAAANLARARRTLRALRRLRLLRRRRPAHRRGRARATSRSISR